MFIYVENDNSWQNFLVFIALRYLFLENIDVQSKLHCLGVLSNEVRGLLINTKDLPADTPVCRHPCPRTGVSADMSGFLETASYVALFRNRIRNINKDLPERIV